MKRRCEALAPGSARLGTAWHGTQVSRCAEEPRGPALSSQDQRIPNRSSRLPRRGAPPRTDPGAHAPLSTPFRGRPSLALSDFRFRESGGGFRRRDLSALGWRGAGAGRVCAGCRPSPPRRDSCRWGPAGVSRETWVSFPPAPLPGSV
ncbi:hypothetical protein VULLAG_LOCUS2958 [Vulpes lagopus]